MADLAPCGCGEGNKQLGRRLLLLAMILQGDQLVPGPSWWAVLLQAVAGRGTQARGEAKPERKRGR